MGLANDYNNFNPINAEMYIIDLLTLLDSNKLKEKISSEKSLYLTQNKDFISIVFQRLIKSRANNDMNFIGFVYKYILPIHRDLKIIENSDGIRLSDNEISRILNMFSEAQKEYYSFWSNEISNNSAVNSVEYYNTKIEELKIREKKLLDTIKTETGRSKEEIQKTQNELEKAKATILKYENEREIKSKQEAAREDWKNIIVETFNDLKNYLAPIKLEKKRLQCLFWGYLISSLLIVILIVIIEIVAVAKVGSISGYPGFKEYITIYLPLPVAGALLWGFIYQMNRAQRQLIVLAKTIHKVEYIQGLLLSINKLAPTIVDGITRINLALDKLINNYFSEKECNSEEDFIKEEKKDVVPVDSLIKILKEIKGVVSKE